VSFNSFDAKSAWGQSALDLAASEMKEALQAAHQRPKMGMLSKLDWGHSFPTLDWHFLKGEFEFIQKNMVS
jgi:hypothetical protein